MDYGLVRTACPYWCCGCQILLEVMEGRVIGTLTLKEAPTKQRRRSIKGWNAHEFMPSPERPTLLLIGKNGAVEETSREEASDITVSPVRASNQSMERRA